MWRFFHDFVKPTELSATKHLFPLLPLSLRHGHLSEVQILHFGHSGTASSSEFDFASLPHKPVLGQFSVAITSANLPALQTVVFPTPTCSAMALAVASFPLRVPNFGTRSFVYLPLSLLWNCFHVSNCSRCRVTT